ncbi:uncharacterized protein PtrM4_154600 [Pyrenophora tritici-repentis]|uniref:Uncharacterized protein n=1 Tax=Pyrenophora tritici-repentis TaxID=45151 RepID=A0A834VIB6_9PLEO|nr:hypothetical protein PtrM4_154600 [Pyrenophora tritici-repentis]
MSSNHTRNLIGMNAVNACRLNDSTAKPASEGTFRLKLSLFDIGSAQTRWCRESGPHTR